MGGKLDEIVYAVRTGGHVPEKDMRLAFMALYFKLHEAVLKLGQVERLLCAGRGGSDLLVPSVQKDLDAFMNSDPGSFLASRSALGAVVEEQLNRLSEAAARSTGTRLREVLGDEER